MATSSSIVTSSALPRLSGSPTSESMIAGPEDAVVDVGEAARLLAVAPDLDLALPGISASATLRQIAAGAFSRPPSKVPCGPYTLWYRATRVSSPKSSREVAAHPLAEQLLPAVAVLRHGRVGVLLPQRRHVGATSAAPRRRRTPTSRRRTARRRPRGGLQEVRVDQHRQHARGLVALDEAHAAHVGGEVVDASRAGDRLASTRPARGDRRCGCRRPRRPGATRTSGLMSTARTDWPLASRSLTRWPPMKPPAPVTRVRSLTAPEVTATGRG